MKMFIEEGTGKLHCGSEKVTEAKMQGQDRRYYRLFGFYQEFLHTYEIKINSQNLQICLRARSKQVEANHTSNEPYMCEL